MGISFGLVLLLSNLYTLTVSLFIFGLGYGAIIPLFFGWAGNTISVHNAASMLSLMNCVASLIAVITTIIIGVIIKNSGLNTSLIIGLLLSVFILISINILTKLTHTKELPFAKGAENENSIN